MDECRKTESKEGLA